jgi:REP element-mobilizing transposase RayT
MDALIPLWEHDGLRLLESRWTDGEIQCTFSTLPDICPVFVAARAKGRLNDALRKFGHPVRFQRNFSIRSVGDNARDSVERYILNQVSKAGFVDTRFAEDIAPFTMSDPSCDLSVATRFGRGLYWYNLHLVLVVADRGVIRDVTILKRVFDGTKRIAAKRGYRLSTLSVMPDHLHTSLRGNPSQSPWDIALCFQNNLAFQLGVPLWKETFYVGSFSEYTMRALRPP